MKDSTIYLKHILDSIVKIEKYTKKGRPQFFSDALTQDAVIRNLEIIGEAVKGLPAKLKKDHPGIPWRAIAGLRDILIHEYFGVDHEIVWGVVSKRIPILKRHIQAMLLKK